ncbi:hypothetical protein [Helicobacter cinaedi]|nr:hypothetical protein [Helicobacter cinaedi]
MIMFGSVAVATSLFLSQAKVAAENRTKTYHINKGAENESNRGS